LGLFDATDTFVSDAFPWNPKNDTSCWFETFAVLFVVNVTSVNEKFVPTFASVPFSWYEPMWLENLGFSPEGEGWRMTESGATQMGGDLPVNCSGGVLSTNPIGASGMIRFGEAALQVRGQAGDHQVDGAKVAVGHAYGGAAQFYATWVVSSEKP
jgi:acetyl-CoA C-acetyltransferase